MTPPCITINFRSRAGNKDIPAIAILLTEGLVSYMEDITTRDEEKARELARERERAQEEERKRQEEIERAKEEARKQAIEQEKARETERGGKGTGIKYALYLVVLLFIIALVAWLSLNVNVSKVEPGLSLPFTTNYGVSFPEGQQITIGNTRITVLSYQNELISDIDGEREKLVIGEDRIISERRAVITTLGALTLMDTHFKIHLKYKGERDKRAYFDMAVHTSRQVPDMLLKQLLPAEIDARPI